METLTVLNAQEYYLTDKEPGWRLELQRNSDQRTGLYLFPDVVFEWRAAEYDLDPDDRDTLLDIVLHEPFAGPPMNVDDDPAYTRGGVFAARTTNRGLARAGDRTPVTLYNADSISDARTALFSRIEDAKAKRVLVKDSPVTGKAESPLARVRAGMSLDLAAVKEKKRYVTLRRKALREQLSEKEGKELQVLDRNVNRKVR